MRLSPARFKRWSLLDAFSETCEPKSKLAKMCSAFFVACTTCNFAKTGSCVAYEQPAQDLRPPDKIAYLETQWSYQMRGVRGFIDVLCSHPKMMVPQLVKHHSPALLEALEHRDTGTRCPRPMHLNHLSLRAKLRRQEKREREERRGAFHVSPPEGPSHERKGIELMARAKRRANHRGSCTSKTVEAAYKD